MAADGTGFRFHAFISYKRGGSDEKYAIWLQQKLERYRIPAEAAAAWAQAEGGSPPASFRIFRDKTDLGSHANLATGLNESLAVCRFLIVICSPRSAASPYVDEEVRFFIENNRAERIIPFIIEGTPTPHDENEKECYPPSLPGDALGITLAEGSREEALIRVAARLLHVDYYSLYQRHLRAQRRMMFAAIGGLFGVLTLVSGLAVWALSAERQAVEQRKEAEGLVSFLTFDLRRDAFDFIPIKARQQITERVADYYDKWDVETTASLYVKAIHYGNQANLAFESGNIRAAAERCEQARRVLDRLRKADPKNPDFLKNSAATAEMQGRIAEALGDADRAEAYYTESVELGNQLQETDPDNSAYEVALINSLNHLANHLRMQGKRTQAVRYARETMNLSRELVARHPENAEWLGILGTQLAALCLDRQFLQNEDPMPVCSESYRITRQRVEKGPYNSDASVRMFQSAIVFAGMLVNAGKAAEAVPIIEDAYTRARVLANTDPDNQVWRLHLGLISVAAGKESLDLGNTVEGWEKMKEGLALLDQAASVDPDNIIIRQMRTLVETQRGKYGQEKGMENPLRSIDMARALTKENPDNMQNVWLLALALMESARWENGQGRFAESAAYGREASSLFRRYLDARPDDARIRKMFSEQQRDLEDTLRHLQTPP